MKRNMNYRMKSLKELLSGYAHEVRRDNQDDREVTKKAIVLEVYARIKDTFDMLDDDPDALEQIYKQLLDH